MINKYLLKEFVSDYDKTIDALVPKYHEMLTTIINEIPINKSTPQNIIELGCGTGNLTLLIAEKFPESTIYSYDISLHMLNMAKEKLSRFGNRIVLIEKDITQIKRFDIKADIIISSLFFHELSKNDRKIIFKKAYQSLPRGGVIINGDFVNCGKANEHYYSEWFNNMINNGISKKDAIVEVEMHRPEPYSLNNNLQILRAIGFKRVKPSKWSYLNFAIYKAEKSS